MYTESPLTLFQYIRILLLNSFPERIVIWTWVRFSAVTELWTEIKSLFERHKIQFQMYLYRDWTPHISVDTLRSTWMSRSLTDGLVVVLRRIGHCRSQTSLILVHGGYVKNMMFERKVNWRGKHHHQIFDAARRMNNPMYYLSFRI